MAYVKRCDELERKLRFFSHECEKFELPLTESGDVDNFLSHPDNSKDVLEKLEVELEGYEAQLRELNNFSEKLTIEYNEKVELQEVLEKARQYFMTDAPRLAVSELTALKNLAAANKSGTGKDNLLAEEVRTEGRDLDMRFSSITGVVSTDEKLRFERMIFRATRGNCFVRFAAIQQPIADPNTGDLVEKSVFIVFYKSVAIENKLKKICDAFQAHRTYHADNVIYNLYLLSCFSKPRSEFCDCDQDILCLIWMMHLPLIEC